MHFFVLSISYKLGADFSGKELKILSSNTQHSLIFRPIFGGNSNGLKQFLVST